MKLGPHPRYGAFQHWLSVQTDRLGVDGVFYRVAGPRHTSADEIIAGVGAFLGGGRWNPPGVMNVVYLSRAPETAMHEANEHARYFGTAVWRGFPKVVIAIRVKADAVLDLTQPAIAAGLPEPLANLMAENWRAVMGRGDESATQALGRAVFDAGIQGLLVPSRPDPAGVNLVLFPSGLTGSLGIEVLNAGELEKLGKQK